MATINFGAMLLRVALATGAVAAGSAAMGLHAQSAPSAAADTDAAGRDLFNNFACGNCHVLADAGPSANGTVGPSLDKNAKLSEPFVKGRIANGQGAMPAFAGQLTDEEIAELTAYIVRKSAK